MAVRKDFVGLHRVDLPAADEDEVFDNFVLGWSVAGENVLRGFRGIGDEGNANGVESLSPGLERSDYPG